MVRRRVFLLPRAYWCTCIQGWPAVARRARHRSTARSVGQACLGFSTQPIVHFCDTAEWRAASQATIGKTPIFPSVAPVGRKVGNSNARCPRPRIEFRRQFLVDVTGRLLPRLLGARRSLCRRRRHRYIFWQTRNLNSDRYKLLPTSDRSWRKSLEPGYVGRASFKSW